MQRLRGWVESYAGSTTARPAAQPPRPQSAQDGGDDAFIYGRVAVWSDDEEEPHTSGPPRRGTAPDDHQQQQQGQQQQRPMHHQHSYSDTDLQELKLQAEQLQEAPELIRLDSGDGGQQLAAAAAAPSGSADWARFGQPPQQQHHGAGGDSSSSWRHIEPQGTAAAGGGASASGTGPKSEAAAAAAGASSSGPGPSSSSGGGGVDRFEAPDSSTAFSTGEEVPDHDHTQQQRELIIYAIPLQRGQTIFLPVCPWRTDPEAAAGWQKAVVGHVDKVHDEASGMWQKMAAAEQGSAIHRLYKFGKRILDSVPAEERLMRGVPKNVSKVVIRHPSQVSPEAIMERMSTMTKSYGIQAVGRAAAATVMLPLAIGVDLVILPGPQVLTYYTMWNLYRNTNGALGTQRMTKFITQGGAASNIRVNYAAEARLDRFYDAAADAPDGVLAEDDIEALVAALREPDLLEPLLSLRAKALRDGRARTSRGGDEYTCLPEGEAGEGGGGLGGSAGHAGSRSSRW